jgi:hypothetical protein
MEAVRSSETHMNFYRTKRSHPSQNLTFIEISPSFNASRYNRELHSLKLLSLYCKQDSLCVYSSTVGKCKLTNTLHTIKQQTRTQYKSIILSIETDRLYILVLQSVYMSIYLTYSNEISDTFTANCSKLSPSRYLQLIHLLTKRNTERSNTDERKFSPWTQSWADSIHVFYSFSELTFPLLKSSRLKFPYFAFSCVSPREVHFLIISL